MDAKVNGGASAAASPGNDEVIKILAKHLAAAKAGNYAAICIVAVSGLDGVVSDYGGQAGLEFPMNFGLDFLKDRVIQGFAERLAQQRAGIVSGTPRLIVPG